LISYWLEAGHRKEERGERIEERGKTKYRK
jgi:hypothetical protein